MYNKETKKRKLSKLKLNFNEELQLKRKKTTKLKKILKDNDNSGDENGADICIYVQESYGSSKLNKGWVQFTACSKSNWLFKLTNLF